MLKGDVVRRGIVIATLGLLFAVGAAPVNSGPSVAVVSSDLAAAGTVELGQGLVETLDAETISLLVYRDEAGGVQLEGSVCGMTRATCDRYAGEVVDATFAPTGAPGVLGLSGELPSLGTIDLEFDALLGTYSQFADCVDPVAGTAYAFEAAEVAMGRMSGTFGDWTIATRDSICGAWAADALVQYGSK